MDVPNCVNCGATLELSSTKTKTGGDMYKCPKWLPNNAGCKGEIWFPPSERKPEPKVMYKDTPFNDRMIKAMALILAELKEINKGVNKDSIIYPDDNMTT